MKKLICTAIVMVTMITATSAAAPAKTFGSVCQDIANAQLTIETEKTSDSWGLPMVYTKVNMFGIESMFEFTKYAFN